MNNLWIMPLLVFASAALGFLLGALVASSGARRSVDEAMEEQFALDDMRRLDFLQTNECDVLFDRNTGWVVVGAVEGADDPTVATGTSVRDAIDAAQTAADEVIA